MMKAPDLLAAYDEQLRTHAETLGAVTVVNLGPLLLVTFPGRRGLVTYRDLRGTRAEAIRQLVADALSWFAEDAGIRQVEWKTREHDEAPGLAEALERAGFTAADPESVMIGEAQLLAVDVPAPAGVAFRRVYREPDIRAMTTMHDEVFGRRQSVGAVESMLRRVTDHDGVELWVAEIAGNMVCTGRLEPVNASDFAGIWGGATVPEWRGRGIYRALTAARARSALALGKTLIHSDSTEHSRPILERYGLTKVTTTTPYEWTR